LKVAVTLRLEPRVRVHVAPELESHPDHPAKLEPPAATALRLTAAPAGSVEVQVLPQSIPFPLTLPEPVPALETVSTSVVVLGPLLLHARSQVPASIAVQRRPPLRVRCMVSPPVTVADAPPGSSHGQSGPAPDAVSG
jgi:hypothetical protein